MAAQGYEQVSLKIDTEGDELRRIARERGVEEKLPTAIRALIRYYNENEKSKKVEKTNA